MSTTITAKCVDQNLKIVSAPDIASGGVNEDTLVVEFCPLWEGYDKTAVFYRTKDEVYHAPLDEEGKCTIPWEVMQTPGYLYLGVFGCKDDITRTSLVARYAVKPGAITEETRPSEPTPNIYEQILSKFIPKGGSKGQVLRKKSDKDHDMEWGEGGSGGISKLFIGNDDTTYEEWLNHVDNGYVCVWKSRGGDLYLHGKHNNGDLIFVETCSNLSVTSIMSPEGNVTRFAYSTPRQCRALDEGKVFMVKNGSADWHDFKVDIDLSGYASTSDIPKTLPNPNELVISSLFEQKRYNGSKEVEITIPQRLMLGLMQTDGVWRIATLDGGSVLIPEVFEVLYANGAIFEVLNVETAELYLFDGISVDTGEVIFARQDGTTRKEAALQANGTVTVAESEITYTKDQIDAALGAYITDIDALIGGDS